jgi:hypothetical protein
MPKKHRYARRSTLPRSLRGKALDIPRKAPAVAPEAEDWAAVEAEFPGTSPTERSLRQKIQNFTYQERFKRDFEQALSLFFGMDVLKTRRLEADEAQIPAFQEWFFYDYVTYKGEHIIDLFAQEKGPTLPPAEAQMLEDWRQWNRYRLFEVLDVHPGQGVTVQDLISGEVLDIHDRSTSRQAQRWAVLLVRTLLTEGKMGLTGSGSMLPPERKADVLAFAQDLWDEYQAENPGAALSEFYREHGLDFHNYVKELAKAPLPKIVTPEGHELVFSRARFAVTDAQAVADRLNAAKEFDCAGPDDEHPEALHYNWLERGRSQGPEGLRSKLGGLLGRQRKEVGGGPDEESGYRALGSVVLWPNRLELECMSRERLATGKALLSQILGQLITHRGDTFESVEQVMAKPEKQPGRKSPAPKIPPEVEAAVLQQFLDKHYATWPDIPLPALGGKTPRQAVRTPEGRKQVAEILKQLEFGEEQKRRQGEPFYDVERLRRELRLS